MKKRPWYRCFPVNFAKFLQTPFSQNTSRRPDRPSRFNQKSGGRTLNEMTKPVYSLPWLGDEESY